MTGLAVGREAGHACATLRPAALFALRSQERVSRRALRRVAVATLTALVCGGALAAPALPVTSNALATPADAMSLLTRIQQAAQRQNYSGTYVHQQGNQVQSSRVVHLLDKTGEHEKLDLLDGQERTFIRNNDDVRCYVPDNKVVLVEKRARYDTFPALLTTEPVDLDRYYQVSASKASNGWRVACRTTRRARGTRQATLRLSALVRPRHGPAAEGADHRGEGQRDRTGRVHRSRPSVARSTRRASSPASPIPTAGASRRTG